MKRRDLAGFGSALLLILLVGCAAAPAAPPVSPTTQAVSPTPSATQSPIAEAAPPSDLATDPVVGTVVRFASDRTSVDVAVSEDNPTVRDFLSLLPLELPFEEFNGREKIAYLPQELDTAGSPGSDPENGDLIYYAPWGNLGFYYNTDGIGYSDATIHIGTYTATVDQLALLEGGQVTIQVVD